MNSTSLIFLLYVDLSYGLERDDEKYVVSHVPAHGSIFVYYKDEVFIFVSYFVNYCLTRFSRYCHVITWPRLFIYLF